MNRNSTHHSSLPHSGRRSRAIRASLANPLQVAISRDPQSTMSLMGVCGLLNATTIATLALAFASIEDRSALHLDVTNTSVHDSRVVRQLESLVDQLEERGVRLRLVGFDPHHPAI